MHLMKLARLALFLLPCAVLSLSCAPTESGKPAGAGKAPDKLDNSDKADKPDTVATRDKPDKPATPDKPAATQPQANSDVIRIKAGCPTSVTDADGNEWEGECGFGDGNTEDRGRMTIEGAATPDLYRTERWGMTRFSLPVRNGKYTVRLHFCETWDGITAPGMRVFDVKVGDKEIKEIKDLDIFKEAGGPRKPLVKTVETTVDDGKLDIQFIEQDGKNHPEINAIEIVSRS